MVVSISELVFSFPSGNCLAEVLASDGSPVRALIPSHAVKPGEVVEMTGHFTRDMAPGRIFLAKSVQTHAPARIARDTATLRDALGISVPEAELLVAHFGGEVFRKLETRPEDLAVVQGFDVQLAKQLATRWAAYKAHSMSDQLLARLGLPPPEVEALRNAIKRHHDDPSVALRENPYLPFMLSQQVSCRSCDAIAKEMGVPLNSPLRTRALIVGALREHARKGNTLIPPPVVVQRVLEVARNLSDGAAVAALLKQLVKEGLVSERGPFVALPAVRAAEAGVLKAITAIERAASPFDPYLDAEALSRECRISVGLAELVLKAIAERICAVDGGDQAGRTVFAVALMRLLSALHVRCVAVAATHASAAELNAALGPGTATTATAALHGHKAADVEPAYASVAQAQAVVIPDAHAMPLHDLQDLLATIPSSAFVCLIGRSELVATAGEGAPYRALVEAARIPVIQAPFHGACGQFWWAASRQERARLLDQYVPNARILHFRSKDEDLLGAIERIASHLFASFGVKGPGDIQVITPARDVPPTPESHNALLRKLLNPSSVPRRVFDGSIAPGDPLLCTAEIKSPSLPAGSVMTAQEIVSASHVVATAGGVPVSLDGDALRRTYVHYIGPVQALASTRPKVVLLIAPNHERGFHVSLTDAIGAAVDAASERLLVVGSDRGFREAGAAAAPFFSGLAADARISAEPDAPARAAA